MKILLIVMYAYLIEMEDGATKAEFNVTGSTYGSTDVLIKFDAYASPLKGPSGARESLQCGGSAGLCDNL